MLGDDDTFGSNVSVIDINNNNNNNEKKKSATAVSSNDGLSNKKHDSEDFQSSNEIQLANDQIMDDAVSSTAVVTTSSSDNDKHRSFRQMNEKFLRHSLKRVNNSSKRPSVPSFGNVIEEIRNFSSGGRLRSIESSKRVSEPYSSGVETAPPKTKVTSTTTSNNNAANDDRISVMSTHSAHLY